MSHSDITLTCPYCGKDLLTCRPIEEGSRVPEIKCMPYTRDVLNFDPDPEDKDPNFNPEKWSKIGRDFLPFLNFERLGILRILDSNINIRYRVARCPNCGDLFDVFLNFTDGDQFCFERIWPHLFARKENSSVEIREYVGNPIILEFVKKVNGIIGNEYVRILFLSMVLFLIGVFPLILASAINHFSLLPGFLLPNFMPEKTFFYLVASIEIAIFLFLEMRFLNYLENTQDFYSLFKVKNKYEGITFWRNFVLSRFVGVQDVGKPAGLSQVDVFSSGAAILIMYAVWLIDKDNSSGFLIPATISSIFLYILATHSFWQRQVRRTKSIYLFCIFLVLLILGEGSILLFGDLAFWGGIFAGIDLFFWLVVAYFFGRVAWLGLNTTLYVIKGLVYIPMNLTIYDQFAQIKSIRKLQNFSTEILLALFLSILVLVTLIVVIFEPIPTDWLDEMRWLLNWLRWGMVLMFFAIGIAIKSIWHIVFAEIYGLLSWSLSQDIFIPNLLPDSKFVLVIGIFLLGGFFLSLVDYQIIQIDNLISRILNKVRNGELEEIDSVVANLRGKINENNIFQSTNNQGSNYKDELVLISSIEQLVSLKGILSSVQVNRLLLRRVSELLFPILTSVFFPILVNSLINMLKGIVP